MENEIKIRHVSSADLSIIETSAKQKGVSREEYLRQLIHSQAQTYYADEDRINLAELIKENEEVLGRATNAINSFVAILQNK